MKSHFGFLSFCLLLTVLLLSSPLRAAFKIDVHINDAENPTLTFGEDETAKESPFPPFSGMFGVVDVCFAGPADAPDWYDRLAEDIKTADDANQWILVAKSNARLTFKLQAGGTYADDLFIVYNDVKTGDPADPVSIREGVSFSVKTGGVYTITRNVEGDPAPNPNQESSQFVAKGDAGTITITPTDFAPKTMNISFAAGMGILAYFDEDLTSRGITLADVDWIIKVEYDGTVAYNWTVEYTELQVTLTPNGTRADGNPIVSMTPNRSSAPPIQTTITTLGDGENPPQITNVIDWILQKFGTLDFDQDGDFDNFDLMYLYNFQKSGSLTSFAVPQQEINYIKGLLRFTSKNPDNETDFQDAKTAFETFRGDIDALKFDEDSGSFSSIHMMYLYNFQKSGSLTSFAIPQQEINYIKGLLRFTTRNPENSEDFEKARNALNTFRDYLGN
jgi:hypothetical protein